MKLIAALVGFFLGLAVAYVFLDRQLKQHKKKQLEQNRKMTEQMEKAHQERLQQTVKSLQTEHEEKLQQTTKQLEQTREELEKAHQERLQETVKLLQTEQEAKLQQTTQQLEQTNEAKIQEIIASLQEEHQTQVSKVTEELHHTYNSQMRESSEFMQSQYETQLQQLQQKLQEQEAQLQGALQSLQSQFQTEIRQLNQDFQGRENEIRESLKSVYEAQIRRLNDEFEQREAELDATLHSLQSQYEIQLKQLKARLGEEEEESSVVEEQVSTDHTPESLSFSPFPEHANESLQNHLLFLGSSPQLSAVPQLKITVNHPDPHIRQLTAWGLGRIATANGLRPEIQQAIPLLGKLSNDRDFSVRFEAVKALGMIKSAKVIPFLQKSLYDTNATVVKTANEALTKFKSYPVSMIRKPKNAIAKKPQNR
ncbi:MAG: HEAT repeat domain-containing protein [Microcoleaceae cyanobacterium]